MRSDKRKVFVFKFRPSSHSDEYTIIAKYPSKRVAKKALDEVLKRIEEPEEHVDWPSGDVSAYVEDNKVIVTVYTAGYLDPLLDAIREAEPLSEETYRNYQELQIRVEVPEGMTLDEAMLVFDEDEAKVANFLKATAGDPEHVTIGGKHFLQWDYAGDEIYDGEYTIWVEGAELDISKHPRWSVECIQ